MEYRFIVIGGGTSGHINPAISIADGLKKHFEGSSDSCKIIFAGRSNGLEGELVPKAGYEFFHIDAKPFPMRPSKRMFDAIRAFQKGKKTSEQLIDEFKPSAVIGTGGYVCAPCFAAANKKKVPVIIHEANAFPGRANKLMGKKAKIVFTGFPNQEKSFPKAEYVIFSGNPVREQMFDVDYEESRKRLGFTDRPVVLAMGGSLGAKTINDFILDAASKLPNVDFVLSSGKQQSVLLDSSSVPSNLKIMDYIDNPHEYMASADVSILRAGASTCAELCAVPAASILIPYPYAANDHQTYNAKALESHGASLLVSDMDVSKGLLMEKLICLLENEEKRLALRENARKQSSKETISTIVNGILEKI